MVLLTSVALLAGGGAAGYAGGLHRQANLRVGAPADPASGGEAGRVGDDGAKGPPPPRAVAADEPALPEGLEGMAELYVRLTDTEEALAAARRREAEKGLLLAEAARLAERAEADLQAERQRSADGSERERVLQDQLATLQAALSAERHSCRRASDRADEQEARARLLETERDLLDARARFENMEARAHLLETERDLLEARCAAIAEECGTGIPFDDVGCRRLGHNETDAPEYTQPVLEKTISAQTLYATKATEAKLQRRLQRANRPVAASTPSPPPPMVVAFQGANASPTKPHARWAPWEQDSTAHASTAASFSSNDGPSDAADAGEVAPARWVARPPSTPRGQASGPGGPRKAQIMS